MVDAHAHVAVWRSVRALPDFSRLLEVRLVSQFGDGLFQAGLAGALLFSPDRAATPWAIAGAFTVLFLPYSLLGPFAGALLDRWDRRFVLVGANLGRLLTVIGVAVLLATRATDLTVLCGALIVNGFTRFVASGLSAALPHVVPREQVLSMNSVATAAGGAATFLGANFMLLPRWLIGAGDTSSSAIILIVAIPVAVALILSLRFHRSTAWLLLALFAVQFPITSTTGRLALCGGYAALAVVGQIINRRHLLATLRAPFEWADDDSGEPTRDGRELVPAGR